LIYFLFGNFDLPVFRHF